MDQRREDPPPQPCICGSDSHAPIRPDGFLRCPERPLPKYALRGEQEVGRGICWARDPATGLHCTEPPHGPDVDHANAYAGHPWNTEIQPL